MCPAGHECPGRWGKMNHNWRQGEHWSYKHGCSAAMTCSMKHRAQRQERDCEASFTSAEHSGKSFICPALQGLGSEAETKKSVQ